MKAPPRYREDGKTYSFNALFISMRSRQQTRIPLRMAILNLVMGWVMDCTPG